MNAYSEAQRLRGRLAAPIDLTTIEVIRVQLEARTIPLSYGSHVRGWHPVRPGHGSIAFESKLEARLITRLAQLPELVSIVSQPITVHYRQADTCRRYTPDFLVELSSVPIELAALGFGRRTLVEVKQLNRALQAEANLVHQFAAACSATGHPIALVTQVDMSPEIREVRHAA